MDKFRLYGNAPFDVAAVHGGPGAGGEMSTVASELATVRGVLEPLQTALSLDGQVEELKSVITAAGSPPVTLIGFSWGAWLCFILAARHPELVKKLILVSSGAFEEEYIRTLHQTRMSRLTADERDELKQLLKCLEDPAVTDKSPYFERFGALFSGADAYDPLPDPAKIDFRSDIYAKVWPEGAELRRSGKLLELGSRIKCPVTAIHGDYDTHPADGVRIPLSAILRDFNFIELKKCGHKPWAERQARDEFFRILHAQLS
ncbi:MAG: alpha/beta hydrolase [Victivallaceae bacterium]|jgi:pimeloyl-ACP methyl ester carboxylesterase